MAHYFLLVKRVSRGNGSRATRAAAYRAGERIRDERTGEVYNHTNRTDVTHAEIVLPTSLTADAGMEWARDRSTLWNAVEHAGRRRNSLLAREVLVNLPSELSPAQRTHLARTFSRELADRYGNAVDFAIHQPRPHSDERHHHAHLLMTSRQIAPEGIGARTTLELSGTERHARGLGPSRNDLLLIRERWATVTNEALREAGLTARIDHRSYKDQGIDREPQPRIPSKVKYAERTLGRSTAAGDAIRARHRERVEARGRGGEELARVLERQHEEKRRWAINASERRAQQAKMPHGTLTRDEREYQSTHAAPTPTPTPAQRWAKLREQQKAEPALPEQAPASRGGEEVEKQAASSAAQSAKNWLAYRAKVLAAEATQGAEADRSRAPAADRAGHEQRQGADTDSQRNSSYDLGR